MGSNDAGVVMDERRHILITGGAGYIGSAVTGALLDRGYFVTVVDKLLHGGEHLLPFLFQEKFSFLHADITQPEVLSMAVDKARKSGAPEL